jgi:hypothetical protein
MLISFSYIAETDQVWILCGRGAKSETLCGRGAMSETLCGRGAMSETLCGRGAMSERLCRRGAMSETLCGRGAISETLCGLGAMSETLCGPGATSETLCGPGAMSERLCGRGAMSETLWIAKVQQLWSLLAGSLWISKRYATTLDERWGHAPSVMSKTIARGRGRVSSGLRTPVQRRTEPLAVRARAASTTVARPTTACVNLQYLLVPAPSYVIVRQRHVYRLTSPVRTPVHATPPQLLPQPTSRAPSEAAIERAI